MLPDLPSPELGTEPGPYVALFLAGLVVGVLGNLLRSRTILATGVLMVMLATFILPLVVALGR